MKNDRSPYYGYRFAPEIISYAVWVYHRFCLSFRDVEDLLAERGIFVSYEAIRIWCQNIAEPALTPLQFSGVVGAELLGTWTKSSFDATANNSISGAPWIETAT
jgi:hypothetical protein